MTNIYLYANGECKAEEFIEDDYCAFHNDGTVYYVQFIEGGSSINLNPTAFYVSELLERTIVHLTDESDVCLVDEHDNYLMSIV